MDRSRIIEGMKFMWDGAEYTTKEEAIPKQKEYEQEGFTVRMVTEEGKYYLFTRRVVAQATVSS
jgi:ribosomal protein L34